MKKWMTIALLTGIAFAAYAIDQKLLEHWQKTMLMGISSQRTAVIKAIEDNKTTEAYNLIEDALVNDPSPDVRGVAAYTMVSLKINTEKTWTAALSSDSNSDVLRKIVFGIGELQIKSAGPKLLALLTNKVDDPKESYLSAATIRCIGKIDYKAADSYLLGVLSNLNYSVEIRGAAAVAIGDLADKKDVPVLQAILQNPGEMKEVRMYSAYGIGKTGDPSAVAILSPFIENESEDLNIRLWSIAGLAYVKDPSIAKKLINFVKVDNVRIRQEAVKALGKLPSSPDVIEILTFKAQYDPELAVKKEAATSLQNFGIDVYKLGKEETVKAAPVSNTISPAATNAPAQTASTNSVTVPKSAVPQATPAVKETKPAEKNPVKTETKTEKTKKK